MQRGRTVTRLAAAAQRHARSPASPPDAGPRAMNGDVGAGGGQLRAASRPPIAPAPKIAIFIVVSPSFSARPMRCSLPVAPFGISCEENDPARHLEGGEAARGEIAQLVLVDRLALAQHDGGGHLLAELGVRHGEGDAPAPPPDGPSARVDLERADLLAAAVDHLLQPPGQAEIAVLVEHSPGRRCGTSRW